MSTDPLSSTGGMASLVSSAIKDGTAASVITKTLAKLSEAPQLDAQALRQAARLDAGVGTALDVKV